LNNTKTIYTFLSIILLCSCSKLNTESTAAGSHIKYFGFSLIDTFWDDPTDNSNTTNYINEVSSFTNIADILVVDAQNDIKERLNTMSAVDVKAYLHLNDLFFEYANANAPSGTNYNLRADYQTRWNQFCTLNNLQENASKIQAFYIGEEPTWNGITFEEIKTVSDYIKTTITDIPIMLIEAHTALDDLIILNAVDCVCFDHYFIKKPEHDTEYLQELEVLKSKLSTENQKLVFVMDTHYIETIHQDVSHIELSEMKAVANSYYNLAKSEPKTIAIIGYFWPSGFDNINAIGARNMPEAIKENYKNIGKAITKK
jgi:hypothetical protein